MTLTVFDDGGASASLTQFISVNLGNANPAAVFTSRCAALVCTFDGTGSFDVGRDHHGLPVGLRRREHERGAGRAP